MSDFIFDQYQEMKSMRKAFFRNTGDYNGQLWSDIEAWIYEYEQQVRADEREQVIKRLEAKAQELSLHGKVLYWDDSIDTIKGGE